MDTLKEIIGLLNGFVWGPWMLGLLALTGLAGSRRCEPGDPLIKLMRRYLDDPGLDREQRAALHHALGKAYNDIADYDEAFYHYKRGKEFVDAKFHIDLHRKTYSSQKQIFSARFFSDRANFGSADQRPVFIVGMPRSGTTLTEQILSSHPQVHGMGELGAARKLMGELDYGTAHPARFLSGPRKRSSAEPGPAPRAPSVSARPRRSEQARRRHRRSCRDRRIRGGAGPGRRAARSAASDSRPVH